MTYAATHHRFLNTLCLLAALLLAFSGMAAGYAEKTAPTKEEQAFLDLLQQALIDRWSIIDELFLDGKDDDQARKAAVRQAGRYAQAEQDLLGEFDLNTLEDEEVRFYAKQYLEGVEVQLLAVSDYLAEKDYAAYQRGWISGTAARAAAYLWLDERYQLDFPGHEDRETTMREEGDRWTYIFDYAGIIEDTVSFTAAALYYVTFVEPIR